SLVAGVYQVLVDLPPDGLDGQGVGVSTLDLTGGAPSAPAFATAALAPEQIVVLDDLQQPIAGATVTAIATGWSGVGASVATKAITNAAGQATLPLVAGMAYSIRVTPPRESRFAGAHVDYTAGDPSTPVALAGAIKVDGTLEYASGAAAAGVKVEAICADCGDPLPAAETTTGAGGAFRLFLPDPAD